MQKRRCRRDAQEFSASEPQKRLSLWRPVQFFYAKMGKDGRIFIPELVLAFFQDEKRQSLAGSIFEVTLEPT
jgi:hypothetical protein